MKLQKTDLIELLVAILLMAAVFALLMASDSTLAKQIQKEIDQRTIQ